MFSLLSVLILRDQIKGKLLFFPSLYWTIKIRSMGDWFSRKLRLKKA